MSEYIEREALFTSLRESYDALKDIYEILNYDDEKVICARQMNSFMECIMRVNEQPAADVVEVKHGRWKMRKAIVFDSELVGYKCSACNTTWNTPTNYCPNCGAKMDRKKEQK